MTTYSATKYAAYAGGGLIAPTSHHARLRVFSDYITYAAQAIGSIFNLFELPIGFLPLYGMLLTDTSSGSATLAIGITGSTGKYRAAAAFTTTNTPTLFALMAACTTPITAPETVFITTAADALPASGTLRVDLYGTTGD